MQGLRNWLFYLGFATLATHELDAMTQSEWRLLYLLRDLPDPVAGAGEVVGDRRADHAGAEYGNVQANPLYAFAGSLWAGPAAASHRPTRLRLPSAQIPIRSRLR